MAKCGYCKQEMTSSKTWGCTVKKVDFPDGKVLPSIKYDGGFYGKDNCHDCNCHPGNYHHPGCDMERCPRCGGQLISCGCLDEDDDEYDFDDMVM